MAVLTAISSLGASPLAAAAGQHPSRFGDAAPQGAGFSATAAAGVPTPPASSTADATPALPAPSTCPALDAVLRQFRTLVPRDRLSQFPLPATGPFPLEVFDLGARYRVVASGRAREYRDDRRDCADRAKVAAVFAALTFDPGGGVVQPPPPDRRSPASGSPPAAALQDHRGSRLELGPAVEVGLGSGRRTTHLGLGLRLALGRGPFALALGAFIEPAAKEAELGGNRLSEWRLPVDLGVRARRGGELVEAYGEAGLTGAWTSERGLDLAANAHQAAVELGAYGLAGFRLFGAARLAPFLTVRAEWVPRPLAIRALPQGLVGHTPSAWMGATLGGSVRF